MKPEDVFLSLGSNVGDRPRLLGQAVRMLEVLPETLVASQSSIYESEPVGYVEQPPFLNLAVQLQTSLTPQQLLKATQAIESALGRIRAERWGPRTLDIDILYWGRRVITTPTLQVPHPEAERRLFVLLPLNEIAADFCPPPSLAPIRELCARIENNNSVSKWQSDAQLHGVTC